MIELRSSRVSKLPIEGFRVQGLGFRVMASHKIPNVAVSRKLRSQSQSLQGAQARATSKAAARLLP